MKAVCIAGSGSGVGKTTVACRLLRHLPGWAALKLTRRHGAGACPHGRACAACLPGGMPWQLLQMHAAIDTPSKDTWRLRQAGADPVLWLIADEQSLESGLAAARSQLSASRGVIIEGTSAAGRVAGAVVIMVERQNWQMPSSGAAAAGVIADVTLLLHKDDTVETIDSLCRRQLLPLIEIAGEL